MKVMLFWVIPLPKKHANGRIQILSEVNLFFQVYPGGMIKLTLSLELPWLVLRGEERTQIRYQSLQRTLVTLATKHCSDQSEHRIHGLYPRAFCWSHLDMNLNKVYLCEEDWQNYFPFRTVLWAAAVVLSNKCFNQLYRCWADVRAFCPTWGGGG